MALTPDRPKRPADTSTGEGAMETAHCLSVTLFSIGDAVIATDAEACVTFMNPVAEALTGWTAEDAAGEPLATVFVIVNEQTRKSVESPVDKALREGIVVGLANHTLLIARDGTERPIDDSAAPIRDEDGEVAGVVLVFRDITERHRHEQDLQSALEYATNILATLREPFLVLDKGLRVVSANACFYETFRASPGDTEGRLVYRLGDGKWDIPALRTLLEELLPQNHEFNDFEAEHTSPETGRTLMRLNARRVHTPGDPSELILLAIEDVTEQRQADELVEQQRHVLDLIARGEPAERCLEALCLGIERIDPRVRVCVLLASDDGTTVSAAVAPGIPGLADRLLGTPVGSGSAGTIAQVVATGEPVTRTDIETDPRWSADWTRACLAAGIRAWHSSPIEGAGSVPLGSVFLCFDLPRAPSDWDRRLASTATDLAGILLRRDALRQTEDRFRALVMASSDVVYRMSPDWSEMHALKGRDFIADTDAPSPDWTQTYILPDDQPRVMEAIRKAVRTRSVFELEHRVRRVDGTPGWVFSRAIPILDAAGEIAEWFGTATDATGRREAQDALRASEHRRRLALDSARLGSFNMDPATEELVTDERFRTVFGVTDEPLDYERALSVIHPEDRDRVRVAVQASTRPDDPAPYAVEYRVVHPDGAVRWVFANGRINVDNAAGGRLASFDGTVADVTEAKRTEQTLARSEQRYRRLFESARDGILILDAGTMAILDANPYMSEILGYTKEEFVGKQLWEIGLFRDKAESEAAVQTLREEGYVRYENLPLETERGTVQEVEFICNVYREDGHEVAQCNIRDITERRRLERQIEAQARELADAGQRKDEFLAMLSHELRNPMAPIFSALHLMGQAEGEPALQREARGVIERQVRHLSRLTDDLLEVSRITTGRVRLRSKHVDLNDVVRQAAERVQPLVARHSQVLSVALPDRPLWILGDGARLEQVVGNLLGNASKYTDDGGHVWLTAEQADATAVLRVRDDGIGMAADLVPRVFDLFAQADTSLDRSEGGLGIGLALVKDLVELHRGTVEATSAGLGLGSLFVVRLPLADARAEAPAEPAAAEPATPGSLRVLVVDDNADAATMSALLLRAWGHEVRVAHDGPAALERAAEFHPDVILLDIGLPGMDGYAVARHVRQTAGLERTRLVAVTGYGQDADRRRTEDAGFDVHLVKPVEPAALKDLLAGFPPAAP